MEKTNNITKLKWKKYENKNINNNSTLMILK